MKNQKKEDIIKKLEEIRQRLNDIEKEVGKVEIPFDKRDLKRGLQQSLNILHEMLQKNIQEYVTFGSKKKGNMKADYSVKIKFLDDDKKDSHWIKKRTG
jgi:archaellum component FlaC